MQLDTLMQPLSHDVFWYEDGSKTKTTGNYGSTSGDASYTHNANNNVSKVYAYNAIAVENSIAKSGYQFMAGIGYPNETFDVDFKFRYVSIKGAVYCGGSGLFAMLYANAYIYDATSNYFVGTQITVGGNDCSGTTTGVLINEGPYALTWTNVNLRNSHIYNAFIETYASAGKGGVSNGKTVSDYGSKWEYIETLNYKNPKP